MKILISNDGGSAHYYIRRGWQNAFNYCGYECSIYDIRQYSPFDVLHKFEADLLITQVYNVDEALYKCIYNRPGMKVIMKAGDYGPLSEKIKDRYPILYSSQEKIDLVKRLKEKTGQPEALFVHHHPDWLEETHGYWMKEGIKVISLLNAADLTHHVAGKFDERLSCDVGFIGGFWDYKSRVLGPYLVNLCYNSKYNIKIFGNANWPVPQYCGFLSDDKLTDFFSSSKISLTLHEPHSHDFGYDITDKCFKLGANGSFQIADKIEGLHRLIPEIPMAESPEHLRELIDYFLERQEERKEIASSVQKKVISNHTYFHRCKQILNTLGISTPKLDWVIEKCNI